MCHFRLLLKTSIDYSDICCLEESSTLFSYISFTGWGGITNSVVYRAIVVFYLFFFCLHFACAWYIYYFEK